MKTRRAISVPLDDNKVELLVVKGVTGSHHLHQKQRKFDRQEHEAFASMTEDKEPIVATKFEVGITKKSTE